MEPIELKERRAGAKLTQAGLGELLGVSAETVKSWELGRNPIQKIAAIAINAVLKDIEAEQAAEARQAERLKHIAELAAGKRPETDTKSTI